MTADRYDELKRKVEVLCDRFKAFQADTKAGFPEGDLALKAVCWASQWQSREEVITWFMSPQVNLRGKCPAELLAEDRLDELLDVARAVLCEEIGHGHAAPNLN